MQSRAAGAPARPLQVRAGLVPLIDALKTKGQRPDDAWLAGDYDVKRQAALCEEVALDMGARTLAGGHMAGGVALH